MKQQHHPTDLKSFAKGVNSDIHKELLGSNEGEHVDALNMRSSSMDGNSSAKKKIKGEQVVYPNIDNRCGNGTNQPLSSDYVCMMTQNINGYLVEIWASPNSGEDSLMRINGKIVLMSPDFPVRHDKPLEYDKNEACVGGEFYITDNHSKPMVFSVKDIVTNSNMPYGDATTSCTDKYFEGFNVNEYVIGITSSMFKMAFLGNQYGIYGQFDVSFGSTGVPVGYHSYSYRFVTADGDRGGWSPITELIPVTQSVSSNFPEHPNLQTYSKDPNVSSPSAYANKLLLKYDNKNGFEFIEVRRDSWYTGSGLSDPPISEILGSFEASDGLNIIGILDYASATETQETLSVEDVSEQQGGVARAKAIRYYNSKLYLMNIGYTPKDIADDILFVDDDNPIEPTIQNLGKKGHKDAYNTAYYKSNMRGEANGFGVVIFDDQGAQTYAKEITPHFEFPNRRDEVPSSVLGTSYKGVPKAATTNGLVGRPTYEVFDHKDAISRGDGIRVNILQEEIAGIDTGPYDTFRPVSQTDPSSTYPYRVNTYVATESNPIGISRTKYDYNPKCFGLNYYAQGISFKGIDSSSLPTWADGFSVVQTNPVGRVVAQGLGFYDMIEAGSGISTNSGKKSDSIVAHFPDLDEHTGVYPTILDDLKANVGASSPYRLELVSPLGFFTEVHSFFRPVGQLETKAADMITYCRILRDKGDVNPHWDGGSGMDGYVGFGTWRLLSENPTMFPNNTNNQNGAVAHNLFTINSIQDAPVKTTIGFNVRINLEQDVYNQEYAGATDLQKWDSNGLRKWTEPVYIVNIVKDSVITSQTITTRYNYTGHYIKFRSKILESDGTATQSARLVSERWEDCIQTINGQVYNGYSSLERFVWVVNEYGIARRWVNITNKTSAQIATITSGITNNGYYTITDSSGSYNVYGVYTSQEAIDGTAPMFVLTFDNLPPNTYVEVRYDNRIPVRVFGGDTFINEHTWAVHDNEYGKNANPIDNTHKFKFNVPLPYPAYGMSPDYRIIRDSSNWLTFRTQEMDQYGLQEFRFDIGLFGGGPGVNPASIRQLVTVWTAETRANLSFAFNYEGDRSAYDSQFFPLKNYVPRPYKWKEGKEDVYPPEADSFLERNHIFDDYYTDYGTEWFNWGKGGFRYKPQNNIDYSKKQNTSIISTKPSLGFNEETNFCSRIIWSVTRPINVQNTPTVKTFPPSNFFDISDDTGEIKFAFDANSDKGNNLYALTANGVCLLMVDKRMLHEIDSSELATVGVNANGIMGEIWISKEIGMDTETWRSWAEYDNMLFWSNSVSQYLLHNNQIKNLTELGYNELYTRLFIPRILSSGKMAGVYDVLHKEYYSIADNNDDYSSLIVGLSQESLQCQSSYRYDKFLSVRNLVYGMRSLTTYKLGVGNNLNGNTYECYVSGASDKDMYYDKEFIRIRVNANSKPKRIEFFDNYDQYITGVPSSTVDALSHPFAIKDYFGYECYIPRKSVPPHYRQQGRVVLFKIVSEDDENFMITTAGVQYKALK